MVKFVAFLREYSTLLQGVAGAWIKSDKFKFADLSADFAVVEVVDRSVLSLDL